MSISNGLTQGKMFLDRHDAGKRLGEKLLFLENAPQTLIIALPRGGVVLGYEMAKMLHLPLDIISPRKIGAPFNPEFAIGAITETGEGIFSKELIKEFGISEEFIKHQLAIEKKRAIERLKHYRQNRPPRDLKGKQVILVDDGLATGSTMQAAIMTVKSEKAEKILVAIPVSPPNTLRKIESLVTQVICLESPSEFYAVGQFYKHFDQTTDEEVISLLNSMLKNNV